MKKILAVMALSVVIATGCTKKPTGTAVLPVNSIAPMEAMGELRNDFAILVDVREPDETQSGIAEPAILMPTSHAEDNDQVWQDFVTKLPRDKKIIIYCEKGRRAEAIAKQLSEMGFKTASMGGYSQWVAAGLPTKKP